MVPMLLVAGVVSVGTFVSGGVALGSVGVVGVSMLALHLRWMRTTRLVLRVAVGVGGVVLSAIGLVLLKESVTSGRSFVSAGVAALAFAGMLTLAHSRAGGSEIMATRG